MLEFAELCQGSRDRPAAVHLPLHGVRRGRTAGGRSARTTSTSARGSATVRALQVRSRGHRQRWRSRDAGHGRAPEHRGGRAAQRLDRDVQRPLLAAAGLLAGCLFRMIPARPRPPWTSFPWTTWPTPPSPSARSPQAVGATLHLTAGHHVEQRRRAGRAGTRSLQAVRLPGCSTRRLYRRVVHPVMVSAARTSACAGRAAQRDLLPLLRRPGALRRPPHAGAAARKRGSSRRPCMSTSTA